MFDILLHSLFIFGMRVTDVSLGTIRMIMITRGYRYWAALIGFFEITIWVFAISKVVGNLNHLAYVFGYSGGFATGTLCGMWISDKLAMGMVQIRITSLTKGAEIAEAIRKAGFGATLTRGEGQSGTVHLLHVITTRKCLAQILGISKELDPKIFVTIEDMPQIMGGYQRLSK